MNKTKIDWCDSTWNPVTGCLYRCEYCYARRMVNRFSEYDGSFYLTSKERNDGDIFQPLFALEEKRYKHINNAKPRYEPYPFGFEPTFHKYRLNDYVGKTGRNIFVCSMSDLFGEWVPDSWIDEVFKACEKAPQHNYLFLTKNPQRYVELAEKGILRCSDNMWYGWSQTKKEDVKTLCFPCSPNLFISVEPILEPVLPSLEDWIIVGVETGRRKDKVIPKREWIEQIVEDCRKYEIPLFMKSSLADIWDEPLIQEFPKELKRSGRE